VALGARGQSAAITCGALALGSIVIGKLLVGHVVFHQTGKASEEYYPTEAYAVMRAASEGFSKLDMTEHRDFMVRHGFTDADSADDIDSGEMLWFQSVVVPLFGRLESEKLDEDAWRAAAVNHHTRFVLEADSPFHLVTSSLSLIDIVFAVLGVATAAGIVKRAGERDAQEQSIDQKPEDAEV